MPDITDTISEYLKDARNAASWGLYYVLEGTGTALIFTGGVLAGAGFLLEMCGEKVKPDEDPEKEPAENPIAERRPRKPQPRRVRAVPQPAA